MHKKTFTTLFTIIIILFGATTLSASDWKHHPGLFNPSGVPSLPFSQPRFADMDADGDMDMILGSTSGAPVYITNTGTVSSPQFAILEDLFAPIEGLDAELAVAKDIDADGDLDLICGGYRGLTLYENTGNAVFGNFEKVDGYFSTVTSGSNPVPDMGDIDADGDLDLIIGKSESGEIWIYVNVGSDTAAVFSESNKSLIGDVGLYAYPVFSDLDNDNDLDILAGKDGLGFVYYKNTGDSSAAIWTNDNSVFSGLGQDDYFNSPALVDLDNDGKKDLIFGNYTGPLSYYNNTGTANAPTWTEDTDLFGGVIDIGSASTPYLYDEDGDGKLDMFTGSALGTAKRFKNTGTISVPVYNYSKTYNALKQSMYSFISIAEVNGDTLPDALVGDLSGNVYLHEGVEGGYSWPKKAITLFNVGSWAAPRFVDMDHDGDQDIVTGNEEGYLTYHENQGTNSAPLWSEIYNYFDSLDVGRCAVPAFADLDFDGDYDMICGNSFRGIYYYENQDGIWVEDTNMVSGLVAKQNCSPCFGDLDGDGDMDLVLGNYDGDFEYYENLRDVVSVEPTIDIPNGFELTAYPNPFNPSTVISFELPVSGFVELSILDLNGKKITTLINDIKPAGNHTLNYSANAEMSTGMYLISLGVDGKISKVNKVTLLK